MRYPTGAIRSSEEMQALIGGHVYIVVPAALLVEKIPYAAPNIGKLHPLRVHLAKHEPNRYMLYVKEEVHAAAACGILVQSDWTVRWMTSPLYFFSNFWFAHAHVQHRNDLWQS
jgi:hypothetical protein